jgi:hypothetical protein
LLLARREIILATRLGVDCPALADGLGHRSVEALIASLEAEILLQEIGIAREQLSSRAVLTIDEINLASCQPDRSAFPVAR